MPGYAAAASTGTLRYANADFGNIAEDYDLSAA
jgi:hypothetical protein